MVQILIWVFGAHSLSRPFVLLKFIIGFVKNKKLISAEPCFLLKGPSHSLLDYFLTPSYSHTPPNFKKFKKYPSRLHAPKPTPMPHFGPVWCLGTAPVRYFATEYINITKVLNRYGSIILYLFFFKIEVRDHHIVPGLEERESAEHRKTQRSMVAYKKKN